MKIENIPNLNFLWAELIIEELARNCVTFFCIAPGSRSTPLTLAAAYSEKVEKVVHFDERGLAFFALGMASEGGNPVALISTSGTAVSNFFPAVIETSKKKVPLILLTADRPPELRKTGSLQTIDQPGIFGKYVRWEFDLPVPDINIKPEMILTTIDQALFMSKHPLPGPVHLNCMFREPLAPEETVEVWRSGLSIDKRWEDSGEPYTKYFSVGNELKKDVAGNISNIINESKKGIIACGKLKPGEANKVLELADKLKWPVFPDLASGLRLNGSSENIIHYFDHILLSEITNKEKIDTVIHLGGRITSKRYYQFIEKIRPSNYITVLNHPLRNDPLHIVSHRIMTSVDEFLEKVIPGLIPKTDKKLISKLKRASFRSGEIIDKYIEAESRISEIFIAREISKSITDGTSLFLSNSMPVRDMDMYASPEDKNIQISGNRGASGIDGIIATACGYGCSLGKPLTLVIGDIAFLHDLNSLALVKECRDQIIIVVINNNGGAIFSFLPVSEYRANFKKFFTTPHGMHFKNAAEQFGIKYKKVLTKKDFSEQYKSIIEGDESMILEVEVGMKNNVRAHTELQSIIKKNIEKELNREI